MQFITIGMGALCCAGGAVAHFTDPSQRKEGALGLAGFGFLLTGMFLSRS